jgi:hypothetical protein
MAEFLNQADTIAATTLKLLNHWEPLAAVWQMQMLSALAEKIQDGKDPAYTLWGLLEQADKMQGV